MSIDQHVQVTATVNNAGVAQEALNRVAILTYSDLITVGERKRLFGRLSEVTGLGFASSSPEALAVAAVLSQSPKPRDVALIRGTRPPTIQYTVDVASVLNEHAYAISVVGEGVTTTDVEYESDAAATQAEIHNGLVTALNAVVGKNFTAAFAALVNPDDVFTADNATETFTAVAHGLLTGDGPFQVSNSGGALPAGLAALTNYWIIRTGADTFQLATSLANALAGTAQPISDDGTGTQTIADTVSTVRPSDPFTVTADAAGDYFTLGVDDTAAFTISQTHADPGIADDINDILLVDSDWYYLITPGASKAMILSAAATIEATPFKFYQAQTNDSDSENTAAGGTDVADDLSALGRKRTHLIYRRHLSEFSDAGLVGKLAPLPVGSWTAAYKSISGSTADTFSTTQANRLDSKRTTYYKSEAGRSITWEGKIGNTDYGFMDVTVSLDFVIDLIQKRIFSVLVAMNKVSYTDEDIAVIAGAAEGAIDVAKSDKHKIVAKGTPGNTTTDPEPTVSFPRVADIDPSVRALRELPDGLVSFRLQGAVHTVDVDLTVTF